MDYTDRKVVIPEDPPVVCLYASNAHITAMLSQEDKFVGIPNGKTGCLMAYKRPDSESISVPFQEGCINRDIDFTQITKDYYKNWFDLDLTDESVTSIYPAKVCTFKVKLLILANNFHDTYFFVAGCIHNGFK